MPHMMLILAHLFRLFSKELHGLHKCEPVSTRMCGSFHAHVFLPARVCVKVKFMCARAHV